MKNLRLKKAPGFKRKKLSAFANPAPAPVSAFRVDRWLRAKKAVAWLAGLVLVFSSVSPAALVYAENEKITICHATGSQTNPYVTIHVSVNALHGHGDHENDIIDPQSDVCPGDVEVPGGTLIIQKVVSGGDAVSSDFSMHVKSGSNDVAGSPQAGTSVGTEYTLETGSYTISESGGPDNYTASFSSSCSGGSVSLAADETVTCTVTNTFNLQAPDVQVTIVKYLDGEAATANSAGSAEFPMASSWDADNIGAGSGEFTLGPTGFNNANPYQATTSEMSSGADYSTHEVMGELVAANCDGDEPYALVGYSSGDTLQEAIDNGSGNNQPSIDEPEFTGLTGDKFVIVWNEKCKEDSEPGTLKVHILKYLDGQLATQGSAGGYQFPMTATWNADNIGSGSGNFVLGNSHGGASDMYGADTASMSAPADYMASEITTGDSLVLAAGSECEPGKYRLLGYSEGDSLAAAQADELSTTPPNFDDLSADKYLIVRNETCPIPQEETSLHFIKVLCPAFSDVAGNAQADNGDFDHTNGQFTEFSNYSSDEPHFADPYGAAPVGPGEIPSNCERTPNWNFLLSSDQGQDNDQHTVTTGTNGEVVVSISDLPTALKDAMLAGSPLWVSEVEAGEQGPEFAQLRCYNDAIYSDNLEQITDQNFPAHVYCIAYNIGPVICDDTLTTFTLISNTSTKSAGFTASNPVADPLNPSLYSAGNLSGDSALASTVIPPWVDPASDSNFTGSGAMWISTNSAHPGGSGGEGSPNDDQWRLFQTKFTVPSGVIVTPGTLYFTADNATTVYLNGTEISNTPEVGTYDPTPDPITGVYANVYSTAFAPLAGQENVLSFVVRNSSFDGSENPTGLLYKATYQDQQDCSPGGGGGDFTLTVFISNAPTDGEGMVLDDATGDINCDSLNAESTCSDTYPAGTVVTLTATPHAGSTFEGSWVVGAGTCTGTTTPCQVTMNSDQTVSAHFSLTSTTTGGGGGGGGGGGTIILGGGGGGGGGGALPQGQVLGVNTGTGPGLQAPPGQVLGDSIGGTDSGVLGDATVLPRTGIPGIAALALFLLASLALSIKKRKTA